MRTSEESTENENSAASTAKNLPKTLKEFHSNLSYFEFIFEGMNFLPNYALY